MKHALLVLGIGLAAAAWVPAAGARSLRADIQCPYGNGGLAWTPVAGNPLAVNPGVSGAYSSLFTAPAGQVSADDVGLSVTAATQYNTYQSPPPAASTCTGGDTDSGPLYPLAQVMNYTLGAGNAVGAAGDIEVEFNYKAGVTSGPASFTLAGVTFSAATLSAANDSDFLFSSSGQFLGSISGDVGSATLAQSVLPAGWTRSGGTASAPEIDAASRAAGLGLLCAALAVLRGRRRA